MDQSLVERMREYLNAGLAMDVEALDALYDPEQPPECGGPPQSVVRTRHGAGSECQEPAPAECAGAVAGLGAQLP